MNVNIIKKYFLYELIVFFASRKLQPLVFNKFSILNANIDKLKKKLITKSYDKTESCTNQHPSTRLMVHYLKFPITV